jgi:hypothetical protein
MTVPQASQSPQRPAHLLVRQPQTEHWNAVTVADLGMLGRYRLVPTLCATGGTARRDA